MGSMLSLLSVTGTRHRSIQALLSSSLPLGCCKQAVRYTGHITRVKRPVLLFSLTKVDNFTQSKLGSLEGNALSQDEVLGSDD